MSEAPVNSATQTPGQQLVEARQRAGLTQQQVAEELKVQLKKLQALEEDNYHLLFSEVFTRGYLRSYAKLLQLDAEALVRLYDAHYARENDPLPPAHHSLDLSFKSSSPWPRWVLLVLVIILLWALAYWYFSTPEDVVPETTQAQPSPAAALLVSEPATSEIPEIPEVSERQKSSSSDPDNRVAETEELAQDESAEVAAGISPANTLDTLELSFTQECWLEVLDARGDALAAELQQPGSRLTLTGEAPFAVKLGNYAQGVSAWVNGTLQTLPVRADTAVTTFQFNAD